jgi:hypothetical protein
MLSSLFTKKINIIDSIDYCSTNDIHRQIVVVHNPGEQFWPAENMAFFKTSSTSNKGTAWLTGTFFPTSGLSCTHEDSPEVIRNYSECDKDNMSHSMGHITKMSNYTTIYELSGRKLGIAYYSALHSFINDLCDALNEQVFRKFNEKHLEILIQEFPILDMSEMITNLFTTIRSYFLTEDQLKLSYQLTPNNTGLWGVKFGDFLLSDFCRERWGPLPKFNVPSNVQCTPNANSVYRFIVDNGANIEFKTLEHIIRREITSNIDMYFDFNNDVVMHFIKVNNKLINDKKEEIQEIQDEIMQIIAKNKNKKKNKTKQRKYKQKKQRKSKKTR